MFDGFKMELPFSMKEKLLKNALLEFKSSYSHKTGELEDKNLYANYPAGAKTPLVRFIIKGNYIEAVGSFQKFFQEGKNYKDYFFKELLLTVRNLQTMFEIDPSEAILHNLEFGLNIELIDISANEVIENCMLYKTKGFSLETFNGKGQLKRAILKQYEVKIYNKGLQNYVGENLIRIEKKVKKMERLGLVKLETILQPKFISTISEELLNLWKDVILFEPNLCLSNAGKPSKKLYQNWSNPNYLNNFARIYPVKYKYERIKYKELIKKYCTHSVHDQIDNSILNKLAEFEKEALKTYTKMTTSTNNKNLY